MEFINSTCQRLSGSAQDKMLYFVQGLRDDIKREVVEQKPIDYQTAENMARLKVSVDKTIADNITKDPGKDILYKLLDKLAPQPTKSTGSEKEPKVAANPLTDLQMICQRNFRNYARNSGKSCARRCDRCGRALSALRNLRSPSFPQYFPLHRWEQNASGSSFSPRPPPQSFKDGRARDGRPTCYRCGKTVHVARNCVLKMLTFRKTLMSRELLQTKTCFFIPRR